MAFEDYYRGYETDPCEMCERIQRAINRVGASNGRFRKKHLDYLVQLQLRHQREHF